MIPGHTQVITLCNDNTVKQKSRLVRLRLMPVCSGDGGIWPGSVENTGVIVH